MDNTGTQGNRQDNGQKIKEKVNVQVASKALKVSTKTVQRWIKEGKISSIKEGNRVFIPTDDIRTIIQEKQDKEQDIHLNKNSHVQTQRTEKGQNEDIVQVNRNHYEGLLTRLGQLEAKQELLLEYKTGLEVKDKELVEAKKLLQEKDKVMEKAGAEIQRLRAEAQKAKDLEAEVNRLRLPWWKRIFSR